MTDPAKIDGALAASLYEALAEAEAEDTYFPPVVAFELKKCDDDIFVKFVVQDRPRNPDSNQ